MRSFFRTRRARMLIAPGALFIAVLVTWMGSEAYRARDFSETFVARKGDLVEIKTRRVDDAANDRVFDVDLHDDRGLVVNCRIQLPSPSGNPTAALVLLGGLQTGKRTIEYLYDVEEVLLLAIDYPYAGKRTGLSAFEFMRSMPLIHDGLMDTVPAAMLAVDYLLSRADVDPDRVVVVGGSLGALFSPAFVATDPRVSALVLLFGAGDLATLMEANFGAEVPSWLVPGAAWAGSLVASPFEPLKYVGRVSPRPVFMLNGLDDPRMPRVCVERMHEAAGDPNTVRFIEAGHVHVRSEEFRQLVRAEVEKWLVEAGFVKLAE